MSELNNRAWAAKILRGLKENSRRFADAGKSEPKARAKASGRPDRKAAPKESPARRRA